MKDINDVRNGVLAELRAEPPPPSWGLRTLGLVLVCMAVVGSALGIAVVADLGTLRPRWPSALLLAIVVGSCVAAVRPGSRALRVAVLGLALAGAGAHTLLAWTRGVATGWLVDPECAVAEIGVALVPALVTAAVLRHFAYQPFRAFVGGIGAGACGLLVLDLTCHVAGVFHALAFHIAPCALVVVAVLIIRSRLTTRSFVP